MLRSGVWRDQAQVPVRKLGGDTGSVLGTAAGAVLSEEALGAHGADRNEERVAWALDAMEAHLARDLGVEATTGHRRGLRHRR